MTLNVPTFGLNSSSIGIGYDSNGVGATLKVKNKGDHNLTVLRGWIDVDFGGGIVDWRTIPFYIPYPNQDYSNAYSSYTSQYTIPSMPNFGGSGTTPNDYNNSHRFVKGFNLRSFTNYGDVMSFDLMFLPYYPGVYSATLNIEYNKNNNSENLYMQININAAALGSISEIDHTTIPQMTISVDNTSQSNVEFYFD